MYKLEKSMDLSGYKMTLEPSYIHGCVIALHKNLENYLYETLSEEQLNTMLEGVLNEIYRRS